MVLLTIVVVETLTLASKTSAAHQLYQIHSGTLTSVVNRCAQSGIALRNICFAIQSGTSVVQRMLIRGRKVAGRRCGRKSGEEAVWISAASGMAGQRRRVEYSVVVEGCLVVGVRLKRRLRV